MCKLSVIVPIYKAEKYLNKCLDSILAQTFTDFELLLIDDGSPDKSGEICDEYVKKDNRVRVFHKQNGGVSSARNIGLDNARGEWITFVDSDDLLPSNNIFETASTYNADMIVFSYIDNFNNNPKIIEVTQEEIQSKADKKVILKKYLDTGIFRCICSKFIKREVIGNIRFDTNIRLGEDTLFIFKCLNNTQSIGLNSMPAYEYLTSDETNLNKYTQSIEKSIYAMKQIFDEYKIMEVTVPMFEYHLFWSFKSVSNDDIANRPKLWFNDLFIKYFYKRTIKCTPIKQRIYYYIERHRCLLAIYRTIRRTSN